jgi:MFS family permease
MRRHWTIALSALVILLVTNGLTISGITVFDESLLTTFGWDRGALKFRDLLQFALAGAVAPLSGALADRFGMRRLMLFGAVLLSVCFVLYSRVGSLGEIYAIHLLFGLVLACCGLIVVIMLVSRWFVARRGTAIGIALVGTSLGGVILPQVGARLIVALGWRSALLSLALLPLALVVLILLVVRDSPEKVGLRALGAEEIAKGQPAPPLTGMDYGAALRTGKFWILGLCAMLTFYCILGAQAHLVLHLRGLGFEPLAAARGLGYLFFMGLIGKFLFGTLADILHRKAVFLGNLAVMFVGSLCLASMSPGLLWPFFVLFGVGWGGIYTLLQLMTVEIFGLKATGKILGTITVLEALGGGLGPWITGVLYHETGSYRSAFGLISGLVLLALIAASLIRIRK